MEKERKLKFQTKVYLSNKKFLSISIIFASLYITIGLSFQCIAFGVIQIRFADALYPLIAIYGLPCLLGCFIGHLIFNIYGFFAGIALGIGDLLSPFIFLIPKIAIYKWKLKAVPIHVIFVCLWVSWLLYSLYGIPLWFSIITVGIGETIAEICIGVPLALSLRRRLKVG